MKSAKELVAEANTRVKIIAATDAKSLLNSADTVFVDLRDSAELQRDGKIPGAVHVNRGMLEFALDPTLPYHNPAFSSVFRRVYGAHRALYVVENTLLAEFDPLSPPYYRKLGSS